MDLNISEPEHVKSDLFSFPVAQWLTTEGCEFDSRRLQIPM